MYLNMELPVFNYHSMERFAAAVMTTVDLCNDTTAAPAANYFFFSTFKVKRKKLKLHQSNINVLLLGHSKQILA